MPHDRIYYWLDDERPNPDPKRYIHFLAAPDLIADLKTLGSDLSYVTLHLDHDLGVCNNCFENDLKKSIYLGRGECIHRGNGYDVLLFLEELAATDSNFVPPIIKIHTSNAAAKPRMLQAAKVISTFNHKKEVK